MSDRLNKLSATELSDLASQGVVSCKDIALACLDRIANRDATVQAWSFLDPDRILREAERLDARPQRGALFGVPIGVKDVFETYDMPTGMGSPIYTGFRTNVDASCVAILRSAGALLLGKTVTCEFAGVTAGPTTNPHDAARTPGGSSSGSAAAVADYMVPLATATQTGGSVQRPSSYCGIVGYKPTYGLINREGLKSAAESLDTIGLMARTVEDVELSARVLTGSHKLEWLSASTSLRIGACRTPAWSTAEAATQEAIEDAARRLAIGGHDIIDIELPPVCDELQATREIINDFERARGMAYEWERHRSEISEGLTRSIERGLKITRDRYFDALNRVDRCRRSLDAVFGSVDLLLTPAAQGEAPVGLGYTGDHRFQSLWTQLRTPTVTLPTHSGPNGMPVSIQIVGPCYGDERVLLASHLIFGALGRGPEIDA